jgi:hypothetical protein
MRLRHATINMPDDRPFANCKLDREKYAEILTSLIKKSSEGFVMAIDSEWGTGKTTFISMWSKYLIVQEVKTLYFNAWENDFDTSPLVALMSELKHLMPASMEDKFKPVLKKGAALAKNILPSLVKSIADKYINSETLTDALKNTTKAATEIFEEEIDLYAKKKKGLVEFRSELANYISENNPRFPLVFFIDELDRCKPSYAVETLEYLKHFFNVPGIVFVLSIDKRQLASAIRGFYGSDRIDANEYLRRFIDIEYTLPDPQIGTFVNYLYAHFQFENFFESPSRSTIPYAQRDSISFIDFSTALFQKKPLTLRQQEKIFSHSRIALELFSFNSFVFPSVFVLLNYFRITDEKLYKEISRRHLTPQELSDRISDHLNVDFNDNARRLFAHSQALLLYSYINYYRDISLNATMVRDDGDKLTLNFKLKTSYPNAEKEYIDWYSAFESSNFYGVKLDYLLNIINLTKNLDL